MKKKTLEETVSKVISGKQLNEGRTKASKMFSETDKFFSDGLSKVFDKVLTKDLSKLKRLLEKSVGIKLGLSVWYFESSNNGMDDGYVKITISVSDEDGNGWDKYDSDAENVMSVCGKLFDNAVMESNIIGNGFVCVVELNFENAEFIPFGSIHA